MRDQCPCFPVSASIERTCEHGQDAQGHSPSTREHGKVLKRGGCLDRLGLLSNLKSALQATCFFLMHVQVPQSSPAMSTQCWQLCICLSIGGASQTVSGSFWCVAGRRLDGKSYFPKCLTEAFCMSDLGRSDTSESCLNRSESI